MTDLAVLVKELRRQGRVPDEEKALLWLRHAASTLADWGGPEARRALVEALPGELVARSRGGAPPATADEQSARTALLGEMARRAGEEDPGKAAQVGLPAIALILGSLPDAARRQVLGALPPPIARAAGEASASPPWPYFLLPQSYDRPPRGRH